MAQTGFTPIQLYSTSTVAAAPDAGNLTNSTLGSELAINITDGKLFYKDNSNTVQVIGWKVRPANAGGTGITSYAVGDILYADTTSTLAKLPDVATGNALISGGVGAAPAYGKIGLTTHISGVLPVTNGGTNASTASITSFNNITGYTASGATGTTSTDLVFSTSPAITTPSVTGDLTMSTGNVVMSNGKGIDFSATPGTGTSELLADYEEGTWTPTLGGGWTGFAEGIYTKVGNIVYIYGAIDSVTALNAGSTDTISGLPYASVANPPSGAGFAGPVSYFGSLAVNVLHLQCYVARGSTNLRFTSMTAAGTTATNNPAIFGNGATIYFAATYIAA